MTNAARAEMAEQRDALVRRRKHIRDAGEMRQFARWLRDLDVPSELSEDVGKIANALHMTANRLSDE